MKENTKNYFKDLIDDFEIELNTIDMILSDLRKNFRNMKKFYKKVIE